MSGSPDPRQALERLIEHFERNLDAIKSPQYNETQARREFIDPLFTLLGWDMDNRQGYAEAYKDVIHEDAIKVGGYTKAPDYCFRIGGTRKFFVEAKKPSVNLKDDPEPAYQLRRYAWSSKLPLSILTDFQELAVYDCRVKPSPGDKASVGRIRYLNYRDYAKEWESLASIFSREAVLKGSFDKYAESAKGKRGTTEVDKAFLQEIESWRAALARNLALRNPNLTTCELNFAVQTTIDRLIFLRICEDRGVEEYARLMALQNGPEVYPRLMGLFRAADERYNSGLFHFESENGREAHDTLTPSLTIDDKVLKDILKGLYYPDSPYEFSVLPADILGQVYEQFLGKVIRLTAGHQAKVEDKPEVKKAGGVYYTPTYIVDYIVKNTVGTMLGSRVKGKGERIKGQGPRGENGDQELSGTDGLAEGDGPGRGDLPSGEAVSKGRDLCSEQSDQESGGIDPIQHRGGIREDSQGGLPPSPLHSPGLADGSGNPTRHSLAAQIYSPGILKTSAGSPSRSGKNADAHDPRSSKSSTLAPLPFTLRVLDPACGSGSFLLGAYQYLLTWYRDQYVEDGAEKWAKGKEPRLYQASGGEWKLTTSERKRILLNHIYGVDIDAQAVEVTKLSLLLKVLEGETKESVSIQRKLFHERALPDLSRNIKCGNSLIGSDFYQGQQIALFDEEERTRINAFDWEDEFPEVFGKLGLRVKGQGSSENQKATTRYPSPSTLDPASTGFDVVIGNPPYGYLIAKEEQQYFLQTYQHQDYQKDLYLLFLERYERLLREKGLLGVIVSNTWLQSLTYANIRKYLATHFTWHRVLCLPERVFKAIVDTHVIVFGKSSFPAAALQDLQVDAKCKEGICFSHSVALGDIPTDGSPINVVRTGDHLALFRRIVRQCPPLESICKVYNGAKPFEKGKGEPPQTDQTIREKPFVREGAKPSAKWSPLLRGGLIHRYENRWSEDYWILYGPWLAAPRDPAIFEAEEKLMVRQTGDSIIATIIPKGFVARNNMHVVLKGTDTAISLQFFLGILNSKVVDWLYSILNPEKGEALAEVKKHHVEQLPIPLCDLTEKKDKVHHDRMVSLVDCMLDLHERLRAARTDHDKTLLQRQIAATDKEIDRLVYDLYGLTDDEIAIVEASS